MSRGFGGHASGREFPQLVVDEREQGVCGLPVTGRDSFEKASHIGHSAECNRGMTAGNSPTQSIKRSPPVLAISTSLPVPP